MYALTRILLYVCMSIVSHSMLTVYMYRYERICSFSSYLSMVLRFGHYLCQRHSPAPKSNGSIEELPAQREKEEKKQKQNARVVVAKMLAKSRGP